MVPPSLPPPQAYTRDVLAAAYEWVRSQPQSIRELASSPDNLVALFMQSRRRPGSLTGMGQNHHGSGHNGNSHQPQGHTAITEASTEAFKQDLRSLAEGMKQFDDASAEASHREATREAHRHQHQHQHIHMPPPVPPPQPISQPVITTTTTIQQTAPAPHVQQPQHHMPPPQPMPKPQHALEVPQTLDARTIEIVRKVQVMCNLSSEREALRLLIAVGYERVRDMFPKDHRSNKDTGHNL